MIRATLILVTVFALVVSARAVELPKIDAVPGGIAIVPLPVKTQATPKVYYKNHRVLVKKVDQQWKAIVGIPLSAKPGKQKLRLQKGPENINLSFNIENKIYPEQRLQIKNKRMVNPSKEDMKRIIKEKKYITSALKYWSDRDSDLSPFLQPVAGRLSSPFGLRRYFNDQARKPHSGLDIAAPVGTPIFAPTDGKIITVGDYFFNGKTVFLDHGQGLVTMYCHLDRIEVKKGDILKRGDRFATVGMSGRVTGPHLHWSISLNNARIDPLLFLAQGQ